MVGTFEWREHDGVSYAFFCPGGPGADSFDELLRGSRALWEAAPPGLLRAVCDVGPMRDYIPGAAQLAEGKRMQKELVRDREMRIAVLGAATLTRRALIRGLSAVSGRVTIVPASSLDSAVAFVTRTTG
jgi:hypothetical protein